MIAPIRFLFYENETMWWETERPDHWRFSWFKTTTLAAVLIFVVFIFWVGFTANGQAEERITDFAAECRAKNGDVFRLGDEQVCVDKSGRLVWLESQRENK